VLDVLHAERFVDRAPAEVVATLLDEGRYVCSERTMYRLLAANEEVRERRRQRRHPEYPKPEWLATGPNQVWSWDITKLRGPVKWLWFYLYAILDIFSRYVVGWMVVERENAAHARRLLAETCEKHAVAETDWVLHRDRGVPMTAKTTAQRLADLGVNRSLSRPHVSDDNPFSSGAVQDREVPPQLPRPLRKHRARHRILPLAVRLVQHRASPCRDRDAYPAGRPLRPRGRGASRARRHPL
jgi:putative transposase